MKSQLELWLEKLNSDEKLMGELFDKKAQYSSDEEGLKKFIGEVFVQEAKENGFDVSIEDSLSYVNEDGMQELTPEMLEDVSGGSMRTQLAGVGLASLLLVAVPVAAKAVDASAQFNVPSDTSISQVVEQQGAKSANVFAQFNKGRSAQKTSQVRHKSTERKANKESGSKSEKVTEKKSSGNKLTTFFLKIRNFFNGQKKDSSVKTTDFRSTESRNFTETEKNTNAKEKSAEKTQENTTAAQTLNQNLEIPVAPPAPPAPVAPPANTQSGGTISKDDLGKVTLKSTTKESNQKTKDSRDNLMDQIRQGKKLKSVTEDNQQKTTNPHDDLLAQIQQGKNALKKRSESSTKKETSQSTLARAQTTQSMLDRANKAAANKAAEDEDNSGWAEDEVETIAYNNANTTKTANESISINESIQESEDDSAYKSIDESTRKAEEAKRQKDAEEFAKKRAQRLAEIRRAVAGEDDETNDDDDSWVDD